VAPACLAAHARWQSACQEPAWPATRRRDLTRRRRRRLLASAALLAQVGSLQAEVDYLRGFLEQLAALQGSLAGSLRGSAASSARGTPALSRSSTRGAMEAVARWQEAAGAEGQEAGQPLQVLVEPAAPQLATVPEGSWGSGTTAGATSSEGAPAPAALDAGVLQGAGEGGVPGADAAQPAALAASPAAAEPCVAPAAALRLLEAPAGQAPALADAAGAAAADLVGPGPDCAVQQPLQLPAAAPGTKQQAGDLQRSTSAEERQDDTEQPDQGAGTPAQPERPPWPQAAAPLQPATRLPPACFR
jgi:hypothetical protein